MATSKEFKVAAQSAEQMGEKLSHTVGGVFQAVLESFDRILETKSYQVASAKKGGVGWDTIYDRSDSGMNIVRHVVRGDDRSDALRMGVIPDAGNSPFTVLWVDIVLVPGRIALLISGNSMDLNLESFDATSAAQEIDNLVRAATDKLLKAKLDGGALYHLIDLYRS